MFSRWYGSWYAGGGGAAASFFVNVWRWVWPRCGDGGGGGCLAAAAVAGMAGVAAVEDNYWQKQLATRALTVAWRHAMTKVDIKQQHNNQPMNESAKAGGGGGGDSDSDGSGDDGDATARQQPNGNGDGWQ